MITRRITAHVCALLPLVCAAPCPCVPRLLSCRQPSAWQTHSTIIGEGYGDHAAVPVTVSDAGCSGVVQVGVAHRRLVRLVRTGLCLPYPVLARTCRARARMCTGSGAPSVVGLRAPRRSLVNVRHVCICERVYFRLETYESTCTVSLCL